MSTTDDPAPPAGNPQLDLMRLDAAYNRAIETGTIAMEARRLARRAVRVASACLLLVVVEIVLRHVFGW